MFDWRVLVGMPYALGMPSGSTSSGLPRTSAAASSRSAIAASNSRTVMSRCPRCRYMRASPGCFAIPSVKIAIASR